MSLQPRRLLGLLLLALSLVAARSFPAETPPAFLLKWGVLGTSDSQFSGPRGVAVDDSGIVYVVDTSNHRIQKFDSFGTFVSMWGWGVRTGAAELQVCTARCQQGIAGGGNGQFHFPQDVALDAAGRVYVSDQNTHRVQRFESSGEYLSQWGSQGSAEGQFLAPMGVAVDAAGNVYVADSGNNRIQRFSSVGAFVTQWGSIGSADGQLNDPGGIAVDADGNVYVAETGNNRVQKFGGEGLFLDKWGSQGGGDGEFLFPSGLAVDSEGNVYVADSQNNRVQKFASDGTFLAKWGLLCIVLSVGVDGCDGHFQQPHGIVVDATGSIFVSDDTRIQKFGDPLLEFFIGEPDLPGGH